MRQSLAPECSIGLAPLVAHRADDGTVLLGHLGTGRFIEVDDDVVLAIHLLRAHRTLAEAERAWPASRGEAPDMVALAEELHARGFVTRIDGEETPAAEESRFSAPRPRFRWAAGRAALAVLLGLAALGAALVALDPRVPMPSYARLSPFDHAALNLVAVFVTFLVLAMVHEFAHYATARAYGVRAGVRLSHRIGMPVLITDVSNAWTLPRGPRIRIFSAGILTNLAVAGLCDAAIALGVGSPTALAFVATASLLLLPFQMLVWARTDLYYIFAAMLGERNLSSDARVEMRVLAARALRRLTGRPLGRRVSSIPRRRRALLLAFAVLGSVGTVVTLVFLGYFVNGLLLHTIPDAALHGLRSLRERSWGDLAEDLATFAIGAFQVTLILLLPLASAVGMLVRRRSASGGAA